MKKIFIGFVFLLMILMVSGCVTPPVDEDNTPADYLTYLVATQAEYRDSESGNIVLEIVQDGVTTNMEYIYNYSGTTLTSLLCVLTIDDSEMAAYVTEGVAYVNINGEKTKAALTSTEGAEIVADYGFDALTAQAFKTFDVSLFNAFDIVSDEDGVVQMDWDPTKYVLISEGLTTDEFLEADERFEDISTNIKAISITIHYANERVTKIESSWTNNDDEVGTISIEFLGTTVQTITFPTDLSTYENR